MSFGRQPIANAFLTPDQFAAEFFYELKVGACPSCRMVQLAELVDPALMFHEHYAFFSGTSTGMTAHFAELAETLRSRYLSGDDPFVVEIGSNDGILLQNFVGGQVRHLGVEPSANVAAVAAAKGVRTVSRFFDDELAREIVERDGRADVVVAANVLCHIADLHKVVRGVRTLLRPLGVLVFEDPYLGDIVEKAAYDQIYDEHAFYFSVTALSKSCYARHGDRRRRKAGGSRRIDAIHDKKSRLGPVSDRVARQMERERSLGLSRDDTFIDLRKRIELSRTQLLAVLHEAREGRRRVVGYGATSKSTTVTNYCGITSELVEFISDTTPIKQGKYTPGTHIPVRPYAEFAAHPPDYALLFAWNHAKEILEKEKLFVADGGRFIVYVPRVEVVP